MLSPSKTPCPLFTKLAVFAEPPLLSAMSARSGTASTLGCEAEGGQIADCLGGESGLGGARSQEAGIPWNAQFSGRCTMVKLL